MEKRTKDSIALSEFLSTFSSNECTVAIDKIVEGCLVPRRTVYNWNTVYVGFLNYTSSKLKKFSANRYSRGL